MMRAYRNHSMALGWTSVLLASASLAGCASANAVKADVPPEIDLTGVDCKADHDGSFYVWQRPQNAQPGDTIPITATAFIPYAPRQLDPRCVASVTTNAPDIVSVVRDDEGVQRLTLAENAPVDFVIDVTATLHHGTTAAGQIYVYDRSMKPLVGTWKQEGGNCNPDDRILEAKFEPDGRIEITWRPFETYVDYWGTYELNADAGTISIEATGGNYIPDDIVAGKITIDGDSFILDGASFGTSERGGGVCSAAFTRISD
ncbi:hypothetical protein [Sphingomicrobium sediminis]|uniref:Lipoprotein n=1 Tax=Sphingomicrobium sediminis TaxID=2950949 RepID=A0A9X2J382_9SPHN|nr:hypothetical protein [Sphingomicrobium sediminis]MCM8557800.1 hypothetical protein [Sphingomicrobium sediminis]